MRGSRKFKQLLPENMDESAYLGVIRRERGSIEAGRATASLLLLLLRLQKSSCVLCLEGKRLVIIAVIMLESNSPRAAGAEL